MIGVNDAGDQGLWHIWQTPHGNGWTPWFSHGIPPGSAGAALVPGSCLSRQMVASELFVVGDDLQPGGLGSGEHCIESAKPRPTTDWANWVPHQAGGARSFRNTRRCKRFRWRAGTFRPGRRRGALAQPANGLGGGLVGVVLTWQPGWALAQLRPCRCCRVRMGTSRLFIVSEDAVMWHQASAELVPMVFHGTPSGSCS